jgi:hypothetical protein
MSPLTRLTQTLRKFHFHCANVRCNSDALLSPTSSTDFASIWIGWPPNFGKGATDRNQRGYTARVLIGKWIERREIGTPGEFEALTDDGLLRALVERLARLRFANLGETQH